ncbi:protein-L-isoaspartate(D-aspartate) O-methyltransferase [Haloferula sp. A504]|uniref:protein-L-isoaspartate(D-aspartate) O-methyltransferase n=1 Tax=Haloferula sp. A504 TaxID=3373601 RepID=UPI0031BFABA2|nr:protein-L-isoaspartate(D-aspartate) O-methyltransferase [Verrucomicrobiaceae bacterium E54]
MTYEIKRDAMIRDQIQARGIHDERVIDAMRTIPRECFVPEESRALAYEDHPLPIGNGQTISQPYIVAYMTQLLRLPPDATVLEIGAGSGYQAAVLGRIAKHVCALERDAELVERAGKTLEQLGFTRIDLREGDGFDGWPEPDVRFDGILVSCAPDHLPQRPVESLRPGGRMVVPIGGENTIQQLTLVTRDADGTIRSEEVAPVRFVPMT